MKHRVTIAIYFNVLDKKYNVVEIINRIITINNNNNLFVFVFQPDVPVGGHQSFPLDESSVYNFPHNQHNNHRCNNAQSATSAASKVAGGPQPSPPAASCVMAASVSNSRWVMEFVTREYNFS